MSGRNSLGLNTESTISRTSKGNGIRNLKRTEDASSSQSVKSDDWYNRNSQVPERQTILTFMDYHHQVSVSLDIRTDANIIFTRDKRDAFLPPNVGTNVTISEEFDRFLG